MPRPNILWIMTDQFHADCLGFARGQVRTPNLDRLATEGVVFDRAYAQNPICAPSRICFLTSQYCHTHGLMGNYVKTWSEPHPDNAFNVLRRAGWRTGMVGKAHLPRPWVEEGCDFIRFCDLCDSWPEDPRTCHYFKYLDEQGLAGWYEDGTARPGHEGDLDGTAPARLPYAHSLEHFTGDSTLEFLRTGAADERPWFCQMSFERPHAPMNPAPEYFDLYDPDEIELPANAIDWFERNFAGRPAIIRDRVKDGCIYPLANPDPAVLKRVLASYYAIITCIDMEIGRVLDRLRETGQYENTVIAFTADHGDFAGEHGLFHKNMGTYECIHRIPFILRTPEGPRGETRHQLIEAIDLYPTFCELGGFTPPASLEGQSLVPILADAAAPGKEEALSEWCFPGYPGRVNALRTDRYRIVFYGREHGGELYDHETDPGESENLWDDPACREVRWEMLQRLYDRVNQYAGKLTMADDREARNRIRYTPSFMVQFGKVDWERFRELADTPNPQRPGQPPAV